MFQIHQMLTFQEVCYQVKGVRRDGSGVIRTDEGVTRGDDVFFPSRSRSDQSMSRFLMSPHPLINVEIKKYQNYPNV